ncbi:MAG TPA: hypothetical protein PLD54_04800, partial [Candidatus Levybacteria bacterium]|nr:hypothetical protein [Candidatus Levybacteria bacterium]
MYNARSQRASRGRGKKSFSRPAGNFGNRFSNGPKKPRGITKLNHDLFVKKAVQTHEATPVVHEIKHVFNDFAICNELKVNIGNKGFATPTPIQD